MLSIIAFRKVCTLSRSIGRCVRAAMHNRYSTNNKQININILKSKNMYQLHNHNPSEPESE